MVTRRLPSASGLLLVGLATVTLAAANWKDELKAKISDDFPLTKLNMFTNNPSKAGAILVVQTGGILVDRRTSSGTIQIDENGNVQGHPKSETAGSIFRAVKDTTGIYDPDTERPASVGDKLYLVAVSVDTNAIRLNVQTLRTYAYEQTDKNTGKRAQHVEPFIVGLVFNFPKNALEKMDYQDVKKVITRVVRDQNDPAAVAKGVVAIGQTMSQVTANLGKPVNIVRLDAGKEIWVYDKLKVTFVDGKVTDVQSD